MVLNAFSSVKLCVERLFGSNNVIPSPDLPTRLQYLHDYLGSYSPSSSAIELIENGTLYPYHRPFIDPERNLKVTKILLEGKGKRLKALLGRVANRFGAGTHLRSCACCVDEDHTLYGMPYWHRSHQLPGVTTCHRHQTILLAREHIPAQIDKQRFLFPKLEAPSWTNQRKASAQQIRFAHISNALLNSSLSTLDATIRNRLYIKKIFEIGCSNKVRVNYNEFSSLLRQHYNDFECFEHRERLLATEKTPLAWIQPLLSRPGRACHPICHLILIDFLFGSLHDFLETFIALEMETSPSNTERVIRSLQYIEHETTLRDTSLSCRCVAGLLGKSVSSIVSIRRALGVVISERRKCIDQDKLTRMLTLLKNRCSASEVAASCEVSVSTVYRIKRENYQTIYDHSARIDEQMLEEERNKRRSEWQSTMATHRSFGVSAARGNASATYAWLYRHDREWLRGYCAQFRNRQRNSLRVDWPRRDSELCARLKRVAAQLQLGATRQRVSRSLLIRSIGEASFVKNAHRLPRLKKMIDSFEEQPFSYQLRRIDMAIQTLGSSKKDYVVWRVKRAAGIRSWTLAHSNYLQSKIKDIEKF
jgi:hypothetical protein